MRNTKQKIIQTAIQLFNEQGVVKTRVQDIAEAVGISPGNLTYHYKTKSELMESVYRFMMKTLEEMAFGNRMFIQGAEGMDMARSYLNYQLKFRFFFLDTLEIIRTYPSIKALYKEQINQEISIIKNLNAFAFGKGFLKPEPYEGLYDSLATNTWRSLHFWLAEQAIRGQEPNIDKGILTIFDLLYPYCTEKGVALYNEVRKNVTIPETQ